MSEAALVNAIAEAIDLQMEKTSDRILRLEASKDWPVAAAVTQLSSNGEFRVLVRRPFKVEQFSSLSATVDAGTATSWRNQRTRKYSILIVGGTTGNLDAGLKDVKRVDRRAVIGKWRAAVINSLGSDNDLAKPEVRNLLNEFFASVESGVVPATQLGEYVQAIRRNPHVVEVCSSLWRVGLMSDPQAIDRNMAVVRARRNRELVDFLRTSDDARVDKVLKKEEGSQDERRAGVARAALKFRETGDGKLLKEIELPTIEKIFGSVQAPTPSRFIDLIALLDLHFESPAEVLLLLEKLGKLWALDEVVDSIEAAAKIGVDECNVRIELNPSTSDGQSPEQEIELVSAWAGGTDEDAVLAASSSSASAERLGSGQAYFRVENLRHFGLATKEVDAYLEARRELQKFEPWLETDAVALLVLKPTALLAVGKFVDAWAALAGAAVQIDDAPGFVEAVQILETVSGPSLSVEWIALGPFHPFRLDPILRSCQQLVERLSGGGTEVSSLGAALEWTLDKCYPAYPTLHRRDQTYFVAVSGTLLVYKRSGREHLPGVREASGLDRILRAIESYSPWLADGISALVIDPPKGGGVAKAFESARRRKAERTVVVNHLTTGDDADALDGFDGQLRFLPKVQRLEDASNLPPVNVVVRFVAENPSAGEAATANWQATRGTHLALEISETIDDPFSGKKTPKIKIDPRVGNVVVRSVQGLYAKLKGGKPVLATMRPLLQTDEAPVLSRLASRTDWVVFAAPGPLGLVSPRTINSTLRFVGRANMGLYGLYAYAADDLFPVRRHFEVFFQKTPVATVSPQKMVDLLVAKAQESGQAVLFAGLSTVPAQVACLVALEIAKEDAAADEHAFVLSLDDLGWTRAWLRKGTRADFLIVIVRQSGEVVFRVVESKSQEKGEKIPCDKGANPFPEAIDQVRGSLDSIKEITSASAPSLDEDLRFASLIEHLMAAVMGRSNELRETARERVFKAINALSRREIEPTYEGLAILTQVGINHDRELRRIDDEIKIVWAGAKEIERTFKVPAFFPPRPPEPDATIQSTFQKPKSPTGGGESTSKTEVASAGATEKATTPAPVAAEKPDISGGSLESVVSGNPIGDLARAFIAAARIHGIAIGDEEPVFLQTGPSLFALGVRLREGTTIQPLRARLSDIARDIGLGDRANEIDVENDAEPRTVRVLLPRPDREFPSLPEFGDVALASDGSYLPLYIGQTVDGRDFSVAIEQWPHMLIAGTTGSGKTTFLKSILKQMAAFGTGLLQTVVVDGKGDTDYFGLLPENMFPYEFGEVQLGHEAALAVMRWATEEMERRRKVVVELARKLPSAAQGVKATDLFRNAIRERRIPEIRPLVLVIDEFADIMLASKKGAEEFENLVQRVSQVGRSRLIHLVLATQRPDKETIRGAIKANLNARAVFRLPTQADSMTVLGQAGAERLMLHGDMLFQHGTGVPLRLQGYRA